MIYALFQNNAFGASSVLCSGVLLSLFLQNLLEMLSVRVVPTLLLLLILSPVLSKICVLKKNPSSLK
jgi:hypothetical protein